MHCFVEKKNNFAKSQHQRYKTLCEITKLHKSVNDLHSKFSHFDNHLIFESWSVLKFWFILICMVWVKEKDSKFRDYKYSDISKLLDFYLRLHNSDKAL